MLLCLLLIDLDHTADVQLHSWGRNLHAALENLAPCMFNYMTDISRVCEEPSQALKISVSGHDWHTLVFAYLDELLFRFCSEGFCCARVTIEMLDRERFALDAIV